MKGNRNRWRLQAWLLGGAAFAGAMLMVWLQVRQLEDGYRLAQLHKQYDRQVELQRKLELSWNRLNATHELEWLAKNRLHLFPPPPNRVIIVSRAGDAK